MINQSFHINNVDIRHLYGNSTEYINSNVRAAHIKHTEFVTLEFHLDVPQQSVVLLFLNINGENTKFPYNAAITI